MLAARKARRTARRNAHFAWKLRDQRATAINNQVNLMIEAKGDITPAMVERLVALGREEADLYAQCVINNTPLRDVEFVRAEFIKAIGPVPRLLRVA